MSASDAVADSDGLYAALGRVPSGLYILTVGEGSAATGMLASWVQQAGFEPPRVTVALRHGREMTDRLEPGTPLVLNVVGQGQKHLLKHFAKGFEPGEPAFSGLDLAETSVGPPALAEGVATIECRVVDRLDAGDHRVLLADVVAGARRSDTPPATHVRNRGDHY